MDVFRFDPPDPNEETVRRVARECYGLEGAMDRLRGERSHNTLVTRADGRRFVLKIASAAEPRATVEFHARALVHLERSAPDLPVARVHCSVDGELVPSVELAGAVHAVHLVSHLPGTPFVDGQELSDRALDAIGSLLGRTAAALADFDDPAADGFMPWDVANGLILDDGLWGGVGRRSRDLLAPGRDRLVAVTAAMATLPRQIIHNDGHAGNLLRPDASSERVVGLIDFGDLVRTVTAADVGVAGANLVPHQRDPIGALAALTAGFRRQHPLSDREIEAIPDLVLARLTLSTLLVEYQLVHAPHIAAAVAGELPLLHAALERWSELDRSEAIDRLGAAW